MASLTEENRRKILIAVDLSNWAEEAFDWYVGTVHNSDAEVICFHSAEPLWVSADDSHGVSKDAYHYAVAETQKTATKVEEKFAAKMEEAGVRGRVVVKFGQKPGQSIVELASNEKVSMVVVGTRGLGTLRRTILGSVSDYVLHHAHCPVTVYRPPEPHTGKST